MEPTEQAGPPAPPAALVVPSDEELLLNIEAFLQLPGAPSPTRFGIEAMREGGLVASLRAGRSLSLKNVSKVLSYMADWRRDNLGEAPPSANKEGENIAAGEADSRRPFSSTSLPILDRPASIETGAASNLRPCSIGPSAGEADAA